MNVSATPRSRKEIRRIANLIRKEFEVENEFCFPIVEIIEYLGADENFPFDYEIVDSGEMTDTYGVTNTTVNLMRIRENVYEGAIRGNPRDRFTLCHEFGHLVLHQPESVGFARGKVPAYCDPEWQANTFAAELMAPVDLIKDMDTDEICKLCRVSYSCAEIQKKFC